MKCCLQTYHKNPRVVRMAELYTFFTSSFKSEGDMEINESTRIHFRREHEWEFRGTLDFEDLSGNKVIWLYQLS